MILLVISDYDNSMVNAIIISVSLSNMFHMMLCTFYIISPLWLLLDLIVFVLYTESQLKCNTLIWTAFSGKSHFHLTQIWHLILKKQSPAVCFSI